MNFWGFVWSSETVEDKAEAPVEVEAENIAVASDILEWQKPSRSWASVFEGFRDRAEESQPRGASSGQHAALRSFTRRAHQLLAKQHQRACESRRALALAQRFATERYVLSLAEAEELDDVLRSSELSASAASVSGRDVDTDLERAERLSGWSTSASSGCKGSDQLLSRWETEDKELRQELLALQSAKSSAASELRSGLRRLRSAWATPAAHSEALPVLAAALPQLAQSCADSLHGDDDWATAEAQLFEALAEHLPAQGPAGPWGPLEPDFAPRGFGDKEVLLNEVPGAGGPRSAEEERDQTALQNLLLRIERLSQRMEEEALGGDRVQQVPMRPLDAQAKKRAKEQRKLFRQARRQLEGQVQKLMRENQALEAKLDADRAERAERARAVDGADGRDGGGPRRHLEKKLSPAERLALSNRRAREGREGPPGGENVTFGRPNSTQIFASQRRVLVELRKELAETYEVLALRSLSESERQLVLARRAKDLQAAKGERKGKALAPSSRSADTVEPINLQKV